MPTELHVDIVTPFGKTYEDTITSCTVPGALGQFQILKNHASMLSIVNIGPIHLQEMNGKSRVLATSGGFCEVKENNIKIIVESAEFAGDIDVGRAQEAKKRAEKRIKSHETDTDVDRAEVALIRALNRMKIAQLR